MLPTCPKNYFIEIVKNTYKSITQNANHNYRLKYPGAHVHAFIAYRHTNRVARPEDMSVFSHFLDNAGLIWLYLLNSY